jgi:ABC-type nickel/cobalt efflux system permease component RcnA
MSLSLPASVSDRIGTGWPRLAVMMAALAIVALGFAVVGWWLSAGAAPPPPPTRSPFGVGARAAAPAATGFGGFILSWQASFYRELTGAMRALRESNSAFPLLAWLGFAYGVFHAAGPGHGKAVISAYIMADDRSAATRAFSLSLAAAAVQAGVAIAIVAMAVYGLGATAAGINQATRQIELASFALILGLGGWLLWRKAGDVVGAWRGEAAACAPGCAHDAALVDQPIRSGRTTLGVVLTAGLRPCAGAIIMLVLAASMGLFWAGIAASVAMALGTALTTGFLALLAVAAKRTALALAGGRGQRAAITIRGLETLAAAFLALLGAVLLTGLWTGGGS